MRIIALLLVGVHLAYAGTHSLKYIYTGVFGNIQFPEFTAVGMVDDGELMYYDSNIIKAVPKTEWIRQKEGDSYWERETQKHIGHQQNFKNNIQILMERFNQSKSSGVHALQLMYGCELEDDGTTRGYYQYGYDGEDFLSLDKSTRTWIAANSQAVISKHKLEATGADANYWKGYLENTCIEWVNKYVSYGKDILERTDPPQVSLLQKDSSSPVICHATGFYPNNIMMTWKKNNEDLYEDVEVSSTLPNEDGSYQKSIILSINPEEWKKNPDIYRCVIQHVAAEKEIVLNENNIKTNSGITASDNVIAIAVGCVLVAVVLAAIVGFIVWRRLRQAETPDRCKTGYKKGSPPDTDSENSEELLHKPGTCHTVTSTG